MVWHAPASYGLVKLEEHKKKSYTFLLFQRTVSIQNLMEHARPDLPGILAIQYFKPSLNKV